MALGQRIERDDYTAKKTTRICNRLPGFGLVHELEQPRKRPHADYVFRLSLQGVRLLTLLGEDVPNYSYYMQQ